MPWPDVHWGRHVALRLRLIALRLARRMAALDGRGGLVLHSSRNDRLTRLIPLARTSLSSRRCYEELQDVSPLNELGCRLAFPKSFSNVSPSSLFDFCRRTDDY